MILTHFIAFMAQQSGGRTVPELRLRRGGTAYGAFVLKSPASVLDWGVDWELAEGETITGSEWSVSPVEAGGMAVVAGSPAIAGAVTSCLMQGGVFRHVYTLANTITTSAGRTHIESITFRVGMVEVTG